MRTTGRRLAAATVVVAIAMLGPTATDPGPWPHTPAAAQTNGPTVPAACGAPSLLDWGANLGPAAGRSIDVAGVSVATTLSDPSGVMTGLQAVGDTLGGEAGHLRLAARGNQLGQVATVTLQWSEPVPGIVLTLLDVDQGEGWTDVVRVRAFAGTTEVTDQLQVTVGGAVTQTGTVPVEVSGTAPVVLTSTAGNVGLVVPGFADRLTVDYGDGPGAAARAVGIGDIGWCGASIGATKAVTTGPTAAGPGRHQVSYQATITNRGGTELADLAVRDDLADFGQPVPTPAEVDTAGEYSVSGTRVVTNSALPFTANAAFDGSDDTDLIDTTAGGLLVQGESITVAFTVTFAPAPSEGVFTAANQVEASGDTRLHADRTADGDATALSDPVTITVEALPAPGLALTKSLAANADEDGSGDVSVGDTLTFAFTVTNTGDIRLDQITVTDTVAGGEADCAATTLAPQTSTQCTIDYVVSDEDARAGVIVNQATARGVPPEAGAVTATAGIEVEVAPPPGPGTPALDIDKVLSTGPRSNGDGTFDLVFTIRVTNGGDGPLADVVMTDDLAQGLAGTSDVRIVSATSPSPDVDIVVGAAADLVTATTAELAQGEGFEVVVRAVVRPGTALAGHDNRAVVVGVSAAGTLLISDDGAVVVFPALGNVEGTVWLDRDGDGAVDPGEPGLSGVVVVASQSGRELARTSTASPYLLDDLPAGGVLVSLDPASLPPDVLAGIDGDAVPDLASVVAVEAGRTSRLEFALVPRFDLSVAKEAVGGRVDAQGNVTWRIVVASLGPGPAPGPTTVVDVLPEGVALVGAGGPGWLCTVAGRRLTCVLGGSLPAGTRSEVIVVARVLVAAGTPLVNSVAVGSGDTLGPGGGGPGGGDPDGGDGGTPTLGGVIPDGDPGGNTGQVVLVVGAGGAAPPLPGGGIGMAAAPTGTEATALALAGAILVTLGLATVVAARTVRAVRAVRAVQSARR